MKKIAVLLFGVCAASVAVSASAEQPAKAEPKAPAQQNLAPVAPANGGTGKVLETMDSGGYTYVNVDLNGKAVWAAAPQCKVKKGDTVTIPQGMPMPGFHSKTLNRTFDLVYFVDHLEVGGEKGKPKAAPKAKAKAK